MKNSCEQLIHSGKPLPVFQVIKTVFDGKNIILFYLNCMRFKNNFEVQMVLVTRNSIYG